MTVEQQKQLDERIKKVNSGELIQVKYLTSILDRMINETYSEDEPHSSERGYEMLTLLQSAQDSLNKFNQKFTDYFEELIKYD